MHAVPIHTLTLTLALTLALALALALAPSCPLRRTKPDVQHYARPTATSTWTTGATTAHTHLHSMVLRPIQHLN